MSGLVVSGSELLAGVAHEQWVVYREVLDSLHAENIPHALGGGFAYMYYTGQQRPAKDLDIFVQPADRDAAIRALGSAGMADLYSQQPYDRDWIYRSYRNEVIVDVIWAMANQRAQIDAGWLTRGPEVEAAGQRVHVVPLEETLWAALYVFQRNRCDWPDALNLLYAGAAALDWNHLVTRVADDGSLLAALIEIFFWLCPQRRKNVPAWILDALRGSAADRLETECSAARASRLDSRPWFVSQFAPD